MKKSNLLKDESLTELKTKHSLRNLYKGSRIPWLKIIIGILFNLLAALLLGTQASNASLLQLGLHTDLKPLWMYTLVYFIDCAVFYITIIGDKALITLTTRIRKKMWAKILKISARDLEKESPSSLLSRITNDADLASKPFTIFTIAVSAIGFIFGLSGQLKELDMSMYGLFILAGVVLALIVAFLSIRIVYVVSAAKQAKLSNLTKFYSEQLSNTKYIKASNGEDKTISKALNLIDERFHAEKNYAIYQLMQALTSSVLQLTLYGVTFISAIIFLKSGVINDLTNVSRFYGSFTVICGGLVNVVVLPQIFSETIGGTKKLSYVFNIKSEELKKGENLKTDSISLNNVSFSYNDRKTIDNASITFEKGKVTALVGPNGSGKSTIIKLLSRLYEASNGDLKVGNKSFNDISLKSWRNNFSVVSQNASLFSGSIKENILYGTDGKVSEEELEKAIKISCLTDLIKEKGLDYDIGVKGSKLSGGEQQRVAIARAFIANKDYLILDEATANLDTTTEAKVIDSLFSTMKNKTIIIIAHTLPVIKKADNIVVLRDGKVEASGNREEMLKSNSFIRIMQE